MNVKEYIEKNRGRFQEELFSLIQNTFYKFRSFT